MDDFECPIIPMDLSEDEAPAFGFLQNHLRLCREAYEQSPEYELYQKNVNALAWQIALKTDKETLLRLWYEPLCDLEIWLEKFFKEAEIQPINNSWTGFIA
jgi:hypothetical protein